TLRYVEPLSDTRTKLAEFFSILLEEIDDNAHMNSMILDCVTDASHVLQLLPPVDFEASLVVRQDIPAESNADAGECVRETGDRCCWGCTAVADIPSVRDVDKW